MDGSHVTVPLPTWDARTEFDAARQAMLRALAAYARQAGPDEIDNEIQATGSAMRQIVVVAKP
jgi:hypothetical protein